MCVDSYYMKSFKQSNMSKLDEKYIFFKYMKKIEVLIAFKVKKNKNQVVVCFVDIGGLLTVTV